MITELLLLVGLISISVQTLFFLKCLNARRRDVGKLSKVLQDAEEGGGVDLEEEPKNQTRHPAFWTEENNKSHKMSPCDDEKCPEKRRKSKLKYFSNNIILPNHQDRLIKERIEIPSKEFREISLKKNQEEPFKEDEEELHPSKDNNFSSLASKFARRSMKSGRNFSTAAYAKTHNQCAKIKVALIHLVKSDTKCFTIKNKLNKSNDDVFNLNENLFTGTSCLKHRSYSEGDIMAHHAQKDISDAKTNSSYSSDDSFDQIEDLPGLEVQMIPSPGFRNQMESDRRKENSFRSLNNLQGNLKRYHSMKRNQGSYSLVTIENAPLSQGDRCHSMDCQYQSTQNRYENVVSGKYDNLLLEETKRSSRREIKEVDTDPDTLCDEFASLTGPVSLIHTISRILISPVPSRTSEDRREIENKSETSGEDVLESKPKEITPEQNLQVGFANKNEVEKNEPRRVGKRIGSVELLPFQKQLELIIQHHADKLQTTSKAQQNRDKKCSVECVSQNLSTPHIAVASEMKQSDKSQSSYQSSTVMTVRSSYQCPPICHDHQSPCHSRTPLRYESQSSAFHESLVLKVEDLAQYPPQGTTREPQFSTSIHQTPKISSSCRSVSMLELNINHVASSDRQVNSLSRLKIDSHSSADWSPKQNHSWGQKRNLFQIHSRNGCQPDSMEGKVSPELMESDHCCDRLNGLESASINFSDKSRKSYVATTLTIKPINRDKTDDLIKEIFNNNNEVEGRNSPFNKNDNFTKKRSVAFNDPNNNNGDIDVVKDYEVGERVDNEDVQLSNGEMGYIARSHDVQSCGNSSGDESVSELSSTSSTSDGHYSGSKAHYTDIEHYEEVSNCSTKSRNSEREKQVIQGLDDLIAGVPAPDYETTDDDDSMKDALGRIDDLSNGIFRPPPLPARVATRPKEYDDNLSTSSNLHITTPPAVSKGGSLKYPDSSHKSSPPPIPNSAHKPQISRSPEYSHNALTRTTSVDVPSSPPKLPHKNVSRTSSEPQKLSSKPPPPPPFPPSFTDNIDLIENGDFSEEGTSHIDRTTEGGENNSARTANGKTQSFVPPKFIAHQAGQGLIKPSEYLKSLSDPSESSPSTLPSIPEASKEDEMRNIPPVPPMPPPPPPAPTSAHSSVSSIKSSTMKSKVSLGNAMRSSPMPSISVTDLQSVQLRKTENKLTKTTSVPLKIHTDREILTQRSDVIAELKMGVDIDGIKKLKHEKVKEITEIVQKEKEEIKKQFAADNFVEQVPDVDGNGNPVPLWKRQMLAKKAAEKAKKDAEEQRIREIEEQRLQNIPPWKRQLIAKKEEERQRNPLNAPKPEEIRRIKVCKNHSDEVKQPPRIETKVIPLQPLKEVEIIEKPEEKTKNEALECLTRREHGAMECPPIPWRTALKKAKVNFNKLHEL